MFWKGFRSRAIFRRVFSVGLREFRARGLQVMGLLLPLSLKS